MNDNRRQSSEPPQLPTVENGKTMRKLMDEYVLTERQVSRTIGYT